MPSMTPETPLSSHQVGTDLCFGIITLNTQQIIKSPVCQSGQIFRIFIGKDLIYFPKIHSYVYNHSTIKAFWFCFTYKSPYIYKNIHRRSVLEGRKPRGSLAEMFSKMWLNPSWTVSGPNLNVSHHVKVQMLELNSSCFHFDKNWKCIVCHILLNTNILSYICILS